MKFTPEVLTALQILKNNAENDFELHRISVLEKDLTSPPVVEVIDNETQKFNDIVYYSNKSGRFHKNIQLHRAVWAYYYGEKSIEGFDVHHIDVNPVNNNIENLQLLTRSKHQKIHNMQRMKSPLEKICPICGKNFIRKDTYSKYCSRECYNKSRYTFHSQEKNV